MVTKINKPRSKRQRKSSALRIPKRALSAFYYFANDERVKIRKIINGRIHDKEDDPELTKAQLMKMDSKGIQNLINKRWKTLSKARSAYYNDLEALDKKRHNEEMKQYNERKKSFFRNTFDKVFPAEMSNAQMTRNSWTYPSPGHFGAMPGYNSYYCQSQYFPGFYAPPPLAAPNNHHNIHRAPPIQPSNYLHNNTFHQIPEIPTNNHNEERSLSSEINGINPNSSYNSLPYFPISPENNLSNQTVEISLPKEINNGTNAFDINASYYTLSSIDTETAAESLQKSDDDECSINVDLLEEILNDECYHLVL